MEAEMAKKYAIIAVWYCYRLTSRYPSMVFMGFVLIWIYRSFPLLFSILIYASPVLVSTAILLGTLLYFGHQNAPQIRKEIRKPDYREILNLKTRVMGDTEIGERDSRNEVRENAFGKKHFVVVNGDHSSSEIDKPRSSIDRKTDRSAQFQPKTTELKRGSIDRLKVMEKFQHRDHEDDKGWETGSEVAETSSPTASMADSVPMIDDLHPLFEPEAPQHPHMANANRYASSDHYSPESGEIINGTDDDDDDEDEETNMDEKEEDVITWTEDDQKNLVNLGTSEQERSNERLENLIARQKVLKNMRIMAEKNMENISSDLALNPTSISTAIKNPFDQNILGSSAPSVMMPRRNPNPPFVIFQSTPEAFQRPNDQFKSFDVGSSGLGPHFVPEPIASGGSTNDSSMHRETSQLSDSKVSSTPDKGSSPSARTKDDRSRVKDADGKNDSSMHKETSELSDSKVSSTPGKGLTGSTSVKEANGANYSASMHGETSQLSESKVSSTPDTELTASAGTKDDPSMHREPSELRSFDHDDDATLKLRQQDAGVNEVKTSGADETGFGGKNGSESSSSSFSDVSDHIDDDDDDDDFRSAVMPLTPDSKKLQIQELGKENPLDINSTSTAESIDSNVDDLGSNPDATKQEDQTDHDDSSTIDNIEERGLSQRLGGLTSWFGWKA